MSDSNSGTFFVVEDGHVVLQLDNPGLERVERPIDQPVDERSLAEFGGWKLAVDWSGASTAYEATMGRIYEAQRRLGISDDELHDLFGGPPIEEFNRIVAEVGGTVGVVARVADALYLAGALDGYYDSSPIALVARLAREVERWIPWVVSQSLDRLGVEETNRISTAYEEPSGAPPVD